jgi:ribosomal protein L21E
MNSTKSEEASPMIKPPTNEFGKKEDAFAHAKKHGGKVMKKTFTHPTSGMQTVSYVVKEETELDEAIKLNSKVKIHAPGKDYHGKVGRVGEIRKGLHDKAPKTYTVDYDYDTKTGNKKSIQLDKSRLKMHNEEAEIDEASKKPNATTRHLRDYPVSDKDVAKPVKKPEKKKPEQGVAEGSDKLQGTPVVSLKDLGDKDTKKDRYGRTVPKKLKKDDPRVKFHKDEKQGVAEETKKMKGKDPCWTGYKMIGTKEKGGRQVPNCVPVKEGISFRVLREMTKCKPSKNS